MQILKTARSLPVKGLAVFVARLSLKYTELYKKTVNDTHNFTVRFSQQFLIECLGH